MVLLLTLVGIWLILWACAYHRINYYLTNTLILSAYLVAFSVFSLNSTTCIVLLGIHIATLTILSAVVRKHLLVKPWLKSMKNKIPKISQTELIALKTGDKCFDENIMSGKVNHTTIKNIQLKVHLKQKKIHTET